MTGIFLVENRKEAVNNIPERKKRIPANKILLLILSPIANRENPTLITGKDVPQSTLQKIAISIAILELSNKLRFIRTILRRKKRTRIGCAFFWGVIKHPDQLRVKQPLSH